MNPPDELLTGFSSSEGPDKHQCGSQVCSHEYECRSRHLSPFNDRSSRSRTSLHSTDNFIQLRSSQYELTCSWSLLVFVFRTACVACICHNNKCMVTWISMHLPSKNPSILDMILDVDSATGRCTKLFSMIVLDAHFHDSLNPEP